MKLSEFAAQPMDYGGGMPWARRMAAETITELSGPEVDPVVYGTFGWPDSMGVRRVEVHLYAALPIGFAHVQVGAEQIDGDDPKVLTDVRSWGSVGDIRLETEGELRGRFTAVLTVGDVRVEAARREGQAVVDLYRACAELAPHGRA